MNILDTVFDNPSLPKNSKLVDVIANSPGLRVWYEVEPTKVTLSSGKITSISSQAGADAAVLANGTGSKQPIYVDNVFAGKYPAAAFDGIDDYLVCNTIPYNSAGIFSWALIGHLSVITDDQMPAGSFAGANTGTWFRVSPSGNVVFQHGNGAVAAARTISAGEKFILIGTSDQYSIRARLNGETTAASATNNAAGANAPTLGAGNFASNFASDLVMTSFLVWQANILDNYEVLSAVEAYAAYHGVKLVH